MNSQVPNELLADAVATAESLLKDGESFAPFMIIDRWADRRTERFEPQDLHGAKSLVSSWPWCLGRRYCCPLRVDATL
jgi:hypothetical protein